MRIIKKIGWIFISILVILMASTPALADDQGGTYTVKPNFPTNQISKYNNGYFDLLVTPGQKQQISIDISNNTNATRKYRILAVSAKTTSQIDTNYDGGGFSNDKSLKYDFAKFGFTPKTVQLKPKSQLTVPLDFTVPNTPFKGIILGGILVRDYSPQSNSKTQDGKSKMQLKNYLNYVIAIRMTEDQQTIIKPELKISNIHAISYHSYPSTGVVLRNTAMGMGSDVSVKATTYLKKDPKIRATNVANNGKIAPNTIFTFPILWTANKRITPGKYHLDMTVKTSERNFKFSRDYTITPSQAAAIDKANPQIKKSYLWLIILIIVIVILLIILGFALFFFMGRGRGRQESNAGFPQNMDGMQKKQFKEMMREQKKQFKAQQKAQKRKK
ncbi:DUF916 and DUF3324 domain-containing protein [Xylocopilactobacillus apicola]|uniref:Cell surface protein n=1 Tax=Xylocopilactobacillus apicola TaxID=2932184 RepID=A0AAU9CZZ9_9LACO|nr:DUF916 and DUF3324 domain-containing protein [Xylocopilactobacillus apicola]BDR59579.1 cell surface protein [Xylocopilactobacillus apicola]